MGITHFYIIKYVHLPAPESDDFPFLLNPCSHLNLSLPLVHWITFSLVYPKVLLWQFPPLFLALSIFSFLLFLLSLFPFTCLSSDHCICVHVCTIYAHIYLLFFRETLFQWAFYSWYLTSSASIFYYILLLKLAMVLVFPNLMIIFQSSLHLISATFNSACHFILHEKHSHLASVYLHWVIFLLCHWWLYICLHDLPPLPDCWKLKCNRVLSSAPCFPVCTHSRVYLNYKVPCLVSLLIYL